MKPNVVIPMAGLGSRFSDQGYILPKPLIDVNGVPMIKAVVDSLGIDGNYIFIVQKSHSVEYRLPELLDQIAPGCAVIEIDGVTDGAARTVLAAKSLIDNDTPLIISNSDHVVVWDSSVFKSLLASQAVIALFHDDDPKWSYAKIVDGKVSEVAEKLVISNNATVGIYGFRAGGDYVKYAEQMIQKDIRTKDEFYVCPVYNELINDGLHISPYFVDSMHGIGTPEDLERYLNTIHSKIKSKDEDAS
jgi:NDP-sugar pyrophosphorylase family protein